MTKEKMTEALRSVADCSVCLGCQDVALGALDGQDRGVSSGELLAALNDMVNSYDDTGCDRCGVVDVGVYEAARGLIERAQKAGMF